MKRLFAYFKPSYMTGLSRLADVGLLGLTAFALLQAGQTILRPDTMGAVSQGDAGVLALVKTESATTALSNVFFRDVSPGARVAAPKVDKGNIKLFGTRPRENGMGSAILSDNGQAQAVFTTGQPLTKGAVLTAVYADRIEISRNGDVRSVYLHNRTAHKKRQLLKSSTPSANSPSRADSVSPSPRAAADTVKQSKSRSFFPSQRTRTRPSAPSQRANANILSALNLSASGSGLMIGSEAKPNMLVGLGLSQGDVITAINGQSVRDRSAMANMYRQLQRGGGMAVTLLRDGQQMTVSINANALKLAQTGR